MWADRPDFGAEEARRLRASVAVGARGLKVWKPLGLTARDRAGRLVAVDDQRLDPLWAAAGELGVPVTIHVADPIAFFDPLDAVERTLRGAPRPPGLALLADPPARAAPTCRASRPSTRSSTGWRPSWRGTPGTTFIGAHVGCVPEDLGRVAAMLAAHPNWHVDIAARIAELGRQPYSARNLLLRFPDRVLFGTDAAPAPAWWATYARFLETRDESFPYEPPDPEEAPDGHDGQAAPGGSPGPGRAAAGRLAGALADPRPGTPGRGAPPRLRARTRGGSCSATSPARPAAT